MTAYKNSNIHNVKEVARGKENRRLGKSDGVIKQNQISRRDPLRERKFERAAEEELERVRSIL